MIKRQKFDELTEEIIKLNKQLSRLNVCRGFWEKLEPQMRREFPKWFEKTHITASWGGGISIAVRFEIPGEEFTLIGKQIVRELAELGWRRHNSRYSCRRSIQHAIEDGVSIPYDGAVTHVYRTPWDWCTVTVWLQLKYGEGKGNCRFEPRPPQSITTGYRFVCEA